MDIKQAKIISLFLILFLINTWSFSQAGYLDSTFNGSGYNQIQVTSGSNESRALAVQSDGKIVTVGRSSLLENDFAIIRYNADGKIDSSFGTNGTILTYFIGGAQDVARDVVIQSDGKIIVGGESSYNTSYYAIARFNTDGVIDSTFGTYGKIMVDFDNTSDLLKKLALQNDGKIVALGSNGMGNFAEIGLFRCNVDGTADSTFGINGKVVTTLSVKTQAESFIIQPDGKIVVVGNQFVLQADYVLIRYNSNGSLDSTFGVNGINIIDIQQFPYQFYSYDMKLQTDGKIIVAGDYSYNTNRGFAVARFNSDGTLDSLFGTSGGAYVPFTYAAHGYSVTLDNYGKIIIAGGSSYQAPNEGFALARFNTDGTLDSTFGINGKISHQIGSGCCAFDIAVQSNNRLLVAGRSGSEFGGGHTIARFFNDDTPVGIEIFENFENNDINIYPNPSTGSFIIDCSELFDLQNTILDLFNLQGQRMIHHPIYNKILEINTSKLPQGLYILTVSNPRFIINKKIIIN